MNFFHHKDLGNHLLQLCPKVLKHPVCVHWAACCLSASISVFQNIKKENYKVHLYREIIFSWWLLQGTFIGLHIIRNSACSLDCSHDAYCWGCQIFMGHPQSLWILLE